MVSVLFAKSLYWESGIREIHLVGQFLDAFFFTYLISHFFEVKKVKYKKWGWQCFFVLLFTAILAFTDFFFRNNFYTFCIAMILVPVIYTFLFYRGEKKIKILVCMIFFSLINMLDSIAIAILGCLADESYMVSKSVWIILFFVRRILFKGVLYLLLQVLMLDIIQKCIHIRKIYWYYLGFVSVFAYILLDVLKDMKINFSKFAYLRLFCSVSCLFFIASSCCMMANIMRLNELQKQGLVRKMTGKAKMQELEQINQLQEEVRKFRHDCKSHLFALDAMVEKGEYEKMHSYLSSMHESVDALRCSQMYTDSSVLNILLGQKEQEAKKRDVDFRVLCSVEIEKILEEKIKLYDFISLISNMCDNSIEAASKVSGGFVRIEFCKKKSYLQIESRNSTASNVLLKNPMLETDKSNKQIHGYGTRIIWDIVQKYDGMHHENGDEHFFEMQILLNVD